MKRMRTRKPKAQRERPRRQVPPHHNHSQRHSRHISFLLELLSSPAGRSGGSFSAREICGALNARPRILGD
jgi:hypothetical protein